MIEQYLIDLSMILLFGTLVSALASKLNISNIFLLVFAGLALSSMGIIAFPKDTIIIISTLAMIVVVFDSTVRLKFKQIEKFSSYGMRLVLISFLFTVTTLYIATGILFDLKGTSYSTAVLILTFATLMFGIDHELSLEHVKKRSKTYQLMETESLLSTPLTLIVPLLLLKHIDAISNNSIFTEFSTYNFFLLVIISIAIGCIFGFSIYLLLNTKLKEQISYLIVLTGSVLSYIISEIIGASGVLSLTVFALVFGNYHIKNKLELEKFTSIFGYLFNIFVFIFFGTVMLIDFSYVIKGTILFGIYIATRFLAINIALLGAKISIRDKIMMSLSVSKGIETAIIILIMLASSAEVPGMQTIINLCLLFSLYGFVISNVLPLFRKKDEQKK